MSSSVGNNHSNGSSNVNRLTSNSSSGAHPVQTGDTGGQPSPGPSQATANGSSQDGNRPTTASYTGLLSQNGNFGDHFWPVNNGSRNGNNTAGSEA